VDIDTIAFEGTVRSLPANEIIRIWERGQGKPYLERAMLLLSASYPELDRDGLAGLTIGQRDALLLALREKTLGPNMQMFARCPQCSENLEFNVHIPDIRVMEPTQPRPLEYELREGEFLVRFRLPNSWDLAAIRRVGDPSLGSGQALDQARYWLLLQCILEARREGAACAVEDLPEEVIQALTDRMEQEDPQADVQFNVRCPTCGFAWRTIFDIVPYLWAELTVAAQRLLMDVHALARAYGWDEGDILAMSASRRQFYLEMAG
jgi:hypothetical protein